MKRTAVALLVALGIGSSALAQGPGQTANKTTDVQRLSGYRDAAVLFERAQKLVQKRDLAGARAASEECLGRAPAFSEAHLLLAKISYLEKDHPKALAEIEAAERSWDRFAAVMERLQADRRVKLSRWLMEKDDSIASFQAEVARFPSQQMSTERQITKLENDKREIERILQETPTAGTPLPAEYRYVHGNILRGMGRVEEAALQYLEALCLKPGYAEAATNLASLHLEAKRYEEARAVIQDAEAAGASINPELTKAVEDALSKSS